MSKYKCAKCGGKNDFIKADEWLKKNRKKLENQRKTKVFVCAKCGKTFEGMWKLIGHNDKCLEKKR